MNSEELLTEIYSSFEPFLPPTDAQYVDCEEVRGKWNVVRELGRKVTRSKQPTCQLYSGHRGIGKSTELLRLKEWMEGEKYFVVYFAADEQDIEPQDAEYADILFACTRHLVEEIKLEKAHNPLVNWMGDRWESLKDLALTEISFDGLSLEQQISQFSKITAQLKAVPDTRRELRRKLNVNTPSLVQALNDFIAEAQKLLKRQGKKGLVIMVDNLDRIVEVREGADKPSNYDEIYLNRSEMLRGLDCHVIYTVPIAMVYSGKATRLEDNYDTPDVLPMVMVRNQNYSVNEEGIGKLKELIGRRIGEIDRDLVQTLEGAVAGLDKPGIFESPEVLRRLCLMSGGHLRNLMQLIQKAIDWTDTLPISEKAVALSIQELRDTYRKQIQEDQWVLLAAAHQEQCCKQDPEHLRLLLDRCLLEYRYYDDGMNLQTWCAVHPLIEGIQRFQDELERLDADQG